MRSLVVGLIAAREMLTAPVLAFAVSLLAALPAGSQTDSFLDAFQSLERPSASERLLSALPADQLNGLYRTALMNPVSHLSQVPKYDPTGVIGFCFGRAMAAHLTARQGFHINPSSIYKLFIVGDMRSNPRTPEWRFHVTTIVPVYGGGQVRWVAIDPIMSAPMTAAQWMRAVRDGWDRWHGVAGGKARFFLTPASAVLPDIRVLPEPESGQHLIELNFVPEENGLQPSALWANALQTTETVYALDEAQAARFFLVTSSLSSTRFDFDGIQINSDYITYNSYFAELLQTFTVGVATEAATLVPLKTSFRPKSMRSSVNVKSPLGFNLAPFSSATKKIEIKHETDSL